MQTIAQDLRQRIINGIESESNGYEIYGKGTVVDAFGICSVLRTTSSQHGDEKYVQCRLNCRFSIFFFTRWPMCSVV